MQSLLKQRNRALLCCVNVWIGTHAMFLAIPKEAVCFWVVQSLQFGISYKLQHI